MHFSDMMMGGEVVFTKQLNQRYCWRLLWLLLCLDFRTTSL